MPDLWTASIRTSGRLGLTGSVSGVIDNNTDIDWLRIEVRRGQSYSAVLVGYTLRDPFLEVYDWNSRRVAFNDDSGPYTTDSGLVFTARYTGPYFVAASSSITNDAGTYRVSVRPYVPLDDTAIPRSADRPTVASAPAPAMALTGILNTTGSLRPLASAQLASPSALLAPGSHTNVQKATSSVFATSA